MHVLQRWLRYRVVEACSGPSHNWHQSWKMVNWTRINKRQYNWNESAPFLVQENQYEYVVCEMSVILSWCHCIRTHIVCCNWPLLTVIRRDCLINILSRSLGDVANAGEWARKYWYVCSRIYSRDRKENTHIIYDIYYLHSSFLKVTVAHTLSCMTYKAVREGGWIL